jgi:cysteine-rich repeat protein
LTGESGCYTIAAHKDAISAAVASSVGLPHTAGAAAPFQLPPTLAAQLQREPSAALQAVASRRCITDKMPGYLDLDVLSKDSVGLTLFGADNAELAVKDLTQPVSVCLALDPALYAGRAEWWTQKASCSFYDAAKGKMMFDGCVPAGIKDVAGVKQVCCNCTHLTEYAAGINPDLDACGDGKISGLERCDDGNVVSGDGCHGTTCQIEQGWACWKVPSICCGPCPPGQYRSGCGIEQLPEQPRVTGSCLACAPGTFKNTSGGWDSKCTACEAGKYATGGLRMLCVCVCVCVCVCTYKTHADTQI